MNFFQHLFPMPVQPLPPDSMALGFLSLVVLWAVIVIVHCVWRGDEDKTDERDPTNHTDENQEK